MRINYLKFTQNTTLWLIVFASFSISLSTAFMSIATVLFMIFWAISGDYKIKFERICSNPAALASIALFCLYAIATLYSSAPWDHRLSFLGKYQKLLFIPLIVSVMHSEKFRQYAINAFLLSIIMVLIISYLKWLGLAPHIHHDIDQGYIVFKGRISHNIFMSFAMFLMMHRALQSVGSIRLTWIILSILACLDILFLVNGRTGQIIMAALIVWFTYEIWGIKSLTYWFGLILLGAVLHQVIPDFPHSRLTDIKQEIASHQSNGAQTSSGQRVEMYKNTITLIKQHPLFGGGTASLENEYEVLAKNKNLAMSRVANPHNQFLLTTQELGILGLAMLVLMWFFHWRASYRIIPARYSVAFRGLILTIVVGSLFNSLLLDASEGKFYCVLAGILLSGYKPNRAID
ncbi:MAG: O-antigen ligase family protein [Methylococcaceae bacterium]